MVTKLSWRMPADGTLVGEVEISKLLSHWYTKFSIYGAPPAAVEAMMNTDFHDTVNVPEQDEEEKK